MKRQIIIDANGAVFGRLCSFAAKSALNGNEVIVINSEKAIISGNKESVIARYKNLRAKGGFSQNGPKRSKVSFMIVKRGIRGMLPNHREGMGREAFLRVKCYNGVPKEFEGQKYIKIEGLMHNKKISVQELSKSL